MWRAPRHGSFAGMWSGAIDALQAALSAGGPQLYVLVVGLLLVMAEAAGVALLIRLRQRRARLAAAQAWTEPLDLQTLRQRVGATELARGSAERSRTRELLDDLHAAGERRSSAPAAGGAAGA